MDKLLVGERLLLTIWVGGMLAIGYMVAPTLFATLDDRQLAGMLAGKMFKIIYVVGLGATAILLLGLIINQGKSLIKEWRSWILIIAFVLIVIGFFVLQPAMQDLKAQGLLEGSEQAAQFAQLHRLSSTLYTVTSLCGLVLVIFGLRKKDMAAL